MKVILVCLCAVAVVVADSSFRLPNDEVKKLKDIHEACQADKATYCDEDLLRNLVENQFNKQVGIHMLCMAEKAGLMKHNGRLNEDTIIDKIVLGAKSGALITSLTSQCAQSKETPEATAVQLWLCFVQRNIHYYHRL